MSCDFTITRDVNTLHQRTLTTLTYFTHGFSISLRLSMFQKIQSCKPETYEKNGIVKGTLSSHVQYAKIVQYHVVYEWGQE